MKDNVPDAIKQYVITQHIAQKRASDDEIKYFKLNIFNLRHILITICQSQPNNEIYVSKRDMLSLSKSEITKTQLIIEEDKLNRRYIIRAE